MSDGDFAVVVAKFRDGDLDAVGGPAQTATTALVQFVGCDFLNRDGVRIPDGELTEFEVADGFVGIIELKENQTLLTVEVPKQDGDMIKGDFQFREFVFTAELPCLPDPDLAQPALPAELTEYAKDLLDIMRINSE